VVALCGQLDVWGPRLQGVHIAGPRGVVAACYLATATLLLWRRSHPLTVLFAIGLIDTVQWLVLGSSSGNGTSLPPLVALYSVGAYVEPLPGLVALPFAAGVLLVHELTNPNLHTGHAVLHAAAWDVGLLAAWLLGALIRARRLYVAELRARLAEAEHEREERARTAVLEERTRIARELHDAVAHGVSVMVVQAEAAEEVLDADPVAARGAIQRVQRTGRDSLTEMRRLVGLLRTEGGTPELESPLGLASLATLAAQLREAGQPVELQVDGAPPPSLPVGIDRTAYRIVQEALTNVLKHAAAPHASVRVGFEPEALVLEINDDGRGRSAQRNGVGHGLAGMRERVALYGGKFDAGPDPGGGFRVRALLPLGRE
jgi:signal transduction histidine kinase